MKIKSNFKYNVSTWESKFAGEEELKWSPLPEGGRAAKLTVCPYIEKGGILSAEAQIGLNAGNARIFMNGFQTWTYCPEYGARDRIRGLRGLPKAAVNMWALDRYGDYHFVDYPYKRGVLHGESYCYFREGDKFLLFASLSEQNGYTLFRYDDDNMQLHIERDCKGLEVSGDFAAFRLFVAEGGEDEVFDAWFREMNVRPITLEPIAGYSSWYNRYQNITEQTIYEDLKGCKKVMKAGDLFQIDDGWEPKVGDWPEADKAKFPKGMKAAADAIHKAGFKAGLWLAPFVAQKDSELVIKHPDWLLKFKPDARMGDKVYSQTLLKHQFEPWLNGSNWGGFYSLDIDNPEVVQYIEQVFSRVFGEWGFDLVKLDFLYGAAPFGSERETRAGRMIRAMKLLRRVCGDHPILGCGVPVMPAFGLVEYCRISCDVGLDWDDKPWMRLIHRERVSTRQAMSNTVFRRQLNGRAYLSDPDVFFLRDNNIRLSDEQKMKLARLNALMGGVFLTSDNMGDYDEEKVKTYQRLLQLRECPVSGVKADENGITVKYEKDGMNREICFR